jgi:N-acetylmuramoyl-L-alanine amidase
VYQLAQRLGLVVERDTDALVTLGNETNSVLLFADPGGQAYLNGTPVGPSGGFKQIRGVLFVPESLEGCLRPLLRPLPSGSQRAAEPSLLGPRIVIDPGHGGKDPGAISPIGLQEKDVNLAVSLELTRLLTESGSDVTMTRESDIFVQLNDRAAVANQLRADLFVSIHADSCHNPIARGYTIYVCHGASSQSRSAARAVSKALAGSGINGRGVREANYRVLVKTEGPAILVELGYLSNRQEAMLLRDRAMQQRLARCIASGIQLFFEP